MAKILIGGGSGLIGRHLSELLTGAGHEVLHLSRQPRPGGRYASFFWDPGSGKIDDAAVVQADHIINLAGAGIADQRWTGARKRLITDSRVQSTELLLNAMERLGHRPISFVAGTAMGYYGNRGEDWLHEDDPPGQGFMPESCTAWEAAVDRIADTGIRTVKVRTAVVLSTRGGALPRIMFPANFLLGTYFGDGRQWFSWIHIDDLCRILIMAMEDESLSGAYNGAAPNPVRNKDLIAAVVKAMNRPTVLVPVPAFALRLALGEMADTVLDSTRVSADKIQAAGFEFAFPGIDPALEDVLRRKI